MVLSLAYYVNVTFSLLSSLWKANILKKVKFFAWQVLCEGVNTMDPILKHYSFFRPQRCLLCGEEFEDLSHFLWSFQFACLI